MSPICLSVEFHHPRWIVPFPFFDIGKHSPYEDSDQSAEDGLAYLDTLLAPFLTFLRALPAGSNIKVGMLITGPLLRLLPQRPALIKQLLDLVQAGMIELLGSTIVPSLGQVVSPQEFERQVIAYQQVYKELWSASPKVYVGHGLIYRDDMAPSLYQMGYQSILVPAIPAEKYSAFCQQASLSPAVKLLPTHTIHPNDPWGEQVDELSAANPAIVSLLRLDGSHDLVSLHEQLLMLQSHLTDWQTQNLRFYLPGNLSTKFSCSGIYSSREYISDQKPDQDLSYWLGNVMQKELFEKVATATKRMQLMAGMLVHDPLTLLQQAELLSSLQDKVEWKGNKKGIIPSCKSWREAYIMLMNILADLETYLDQIESERNESR